MTAGEEDEGEVEEGVAGAVGLMTAACARPMTAGAAAAAPEEEDEGFFSP